MRLLKLLTLSSLLLLSAVAQSSITYTSPPQKCPNSISGCTLHDLTTSDPTVTPWGWFVGGVYWTQFDFQLFQGQNAAAGATYCTGTGVYSQTPRPDLGANYAEWTLSCQSDQWTNASGPGEVPSGPYTIAVDLLAVETQVPVKMCGRTGCTIRIQTVWTVTQGTVVLTPVAN